jgi:hypothetical protein
MNGVMTSYCKLLLSLRKLKKTFNRLSKHSKRYKFRNSSNMKRILIKLRILKLYKWRRCKSIWILKFRMNFKSLLRLRQLLKCRLQLKFKFKIKLLLPARTMMMTMMKRWIVMLKVTLQPPRKLWIWCRLKLILLSIHLLMPMTQI